MKHKRILDKYVPSRDSLEQYSLHIASVVQSHLPHNIRLMNNGHVFGIFNSNMDATYLDYLKGADIFDCVPDNRHLFRIGPNHTSMNSMCLEEMVLASYKHHKHVKKYKHGTISIRTIFRNNSDSLIAIKNITKFITKQAQISLRVDNIEQTIDRYWDLFFGKIAYTKGSPFRLGEKLHVKLKGKDNFDISFKIYPELPGRGISVIINILPNSVLLVENVHEDFLIEIMLFISKTIENFSDVTECLEKDIIHKIKKSLSSYGVISWISEPVTVIEPDPSIIYRDLTTYTRDTVFFSYEGA